MMAIDLDSVVEDLRELVRINSQNPRPGEYECERWLRDRLAGAGIETDTQFVAPGRSNVIATVPGRGDRPRLVLLAHMDTVPIGSGWTVPPLDAIVRDGRVWGRGAADMKAGLAVAVNLLEALVASAPPAGDVVLCATVDEEGPEMLGAHALVEGRRVGSGDQVVALEPTGLRLRIAQVGLRWLELEVQGRMAHAGRAPLGVDANHVMALIVARTKDRVASWPVPEHPLLGRPLCTCGRIAGGVATNVVPGSCTAHLDVRIVPPLTPSDAEALVRDVCSEVVADFPGASCQVRPLGVARPPIVADERSAIVGGLREAFERTVGRAMQSGGADGHEAYTDASMVSALTGSGSCVVFGPGSSDQAHIADEFVEISDLEIAARTLGRLVVDW